MFKTAPVVEPAVDTIVTAEPLVPLSVLSLDLESPAEGWRVYLSSRDIAVVVDDIGRLSISRDNARQLFTERRESEVRQAAKREAMERDAIQRDQQFRSQLWGGVPADHLPVGATPPA
jgi:hypothetical protein